MIASLRFTSALVLCAGLQLAALPAAAASFDGTWEGALHYDKAPETPAELDRTYDDVPCRMVIHGPVVQVFVREKDATDFHEVKPGAFHIAPVEDNAVIYATDFSKFAGGEWVETWTFAVTLRDSDTLLAQYSRLVNNLGPESGDTNAKFGTRGSLLLQRMPASGADAPPSNDAAPESQTPPPHEPRPSKGGDI